MSKEPKRNVYVGHRYVPKIMGEWDQEETYEGLSIVTNQGTSYTSKKRVPVGVDILNEEYWVVTGNYDVQVEEYRQEVRDMQDHVTNEISSVNTVLTSTLKDIQQRGINVANYVVGDGVTDDTEGFQEAGDVARSLNLPLYLPKETVCKVSSMVNLRYIDEVMLLGTINSYVNDICILVGGEANVVYPINIYINDVRDKNETVNTIGIRVMGVKNANITINLCYSVQFYVEDNDDSRSIYDNSISYGEFHLGTIDKLDFHVKNGRAWITECNIYGGRYKEVNVGTGNGEIQVDSLVFHKPCVEGGTINFYNAKLNKMYDVRTEDETEIYFSDNTLRNVVYDGYAYRNSSIETTIPVIDEGINNLVVNHIQDHHIPVQFVSLINDNDMDKYDFSTSDTIDENRIVTNPFGVLFLKKFNTEQITRLTTTSKNDNLRIEVKCYNEYDEVLTEERDGKLLYGTLLNWDSEREIYRNRSNIGNVTFGIVNKKVKYFTYYLRTGFETAGTVIDELSIHGEFLRDNLLYADNIKKMFISNDGFSKLLQLENEWEGRLTVSKNSHDIVRLKGSIYNGIDLTSTVVTSLPSKYFDDSSFKTFSGYNISKGHVYNGFVITDNGDIEIRRPLLDEFEGTISIDVSFQL